MGIAAIAWNMFDFQLSTVVTSVGAIVCGTVNHVGSVIMKELEKPKD